MCAKDATWDGFNKNLNGKVKMFPQVVVRFEPHGLLAWVANMLPIKPSPPPVIIYLFQVPISYT